MLLEATQRLSVVLVQTYSIQNTLTCLHCRERRECAVVRVIWGVGVPYVYALCTSRAHSPEVQSARTLH